MDFINKIFILLLSLILVLTGSVFVGTSARADSLEVLGGVVTWPDKMYLPDGCSTFPFQYRNNTGVQLLRLGFIITDPFGRSVENQAEIGIDPNKSGTWNVQMCAWDFKNGLGPYIIKVEVKDFGNTQRELQKEIYFLSIPNSAGSSSSGSQLSPAPTPTVYATNPSDKNLADLVTNLKSQVALLNAKIKKICAAKPKPKGC